MPIRWIRHESLSGPLALQVIFGRLGLENFANPGNANMLMAVPLLAGLYASPPRVGPDPAGV